MNTHPDRTLQVSLAVMRVLTAAFFMVWALEKIVAPDVARLVFETFYLSSPSNLALLTTGTLQAVIVLAFAAGLFKLWTYGALLAMHTVSLVSTVPRLINPFELPNHLFWAAVPLWGLLLTLFLLRDRDTLFTVHPPRTTEHDVQPTPSST